MPPETKVTVVSWNCLADCYALGTAVGKQRTCQLLISWPYRWQRITTILRNYDADIVCLQEVDHYDSHFKPFLNRLGYSVCYVPRPGREDGVLVAFKTSKFRLVRAERIHFDDLADVKTLHLPLSIRDRLKRQNVALILVLESNSVVMGSEMISSQSFSVSTTHLYWNPVASHIKLAQAIYLMERIGDVHGSLEKPPVASILTGDFNSLPASQTYKRILRGARFRSSVRASTVNASHEACKHLVMRCRNGECIKFLCDSTLTRMMRWLRLLGVDVALEDKHAEERRSQFNDFSFLFEQARAEGRVIVTTSTNMLRRSMCPEIFIVNPSSGSLESQVSKLLNFYNVKLNKSDILSICGKCGGRIETCETEDPRLEGKPIPRDRQLYVCIQCYQPYWNGDSESAVSARALRQAQTLFAYVEADRKMNMQYADGVSKIGKPQTKSSSSPAVGDEISEVETPRCTTQSSSELLHNENVFKTELLRYSSAFEKVHDREPMYTNVNGTFRGTLDYIFVAGLCTVSTSEVVKSFSRKKEKHAFPNRDWPSDHMLLCADVVLQKPMSSRSPFARSSSLSSLKTIAFDSISVNR